MSGRQEKGTRRSRANPRLIKAYRSYTVAEVARTFGFHKNTVCLWFEAGLARNDDQRPILILGSDLKSFLTDRRGKAKRKCAPGEMYCVRCRSPKKAAGGMADYVPITPTLGNLKGLCPDCESVMNRRASRAGVELIRGELEITFREAQPQVNESQQPTLNSDFRQGPKHNAQNERTKRKYMEFLKEASQYSEPTVDACAKALHRFEVYTKFKDFKAFHIQQAVGFKNHLADQKNARSGEALSKATLYATLNYLKRFFQWLAWQPGYRSALNRNDADYFNLSDKDVRVATARREQKAPTLEQVQHVIATMPSGSEIERRNRTLVAFMLLTGARDGAVASLKLKHVDLTERCLHQDGRDVKTKFSKTFDTFFFPVGEDIIEIVVDWVSYLRRDKLWGNDDPLFPATRIAQGATMHFQVCGLDRSHWRSASAIRTIFRQAFVAAGLPYFHPHSLRNTLVQVGQERCGSPEEYKAWSQNLGHEKVLTTFLSYGEVGTKRQADIIQGLATQIKTTRGDEASLAEFVQRLRANADR